MLEGGRFTQEEKDTYLQKGEIDQYRLDTPENRQKAGEQPIDPDLQRKFDDVARHIKAQDAKIAELQKTDTELKKEDERQRGVDDNHDNGFRKILGDEFEKKELAIVETVGNGYGEWWKTVDFSGNVEKVELA